MKTNKQIFLVAGMVTTMFLAGCGKIPQQDIDTANDAIEAAKTAGAEIYAAENFAALQDSMKVVMEGIEAGKSKFFGNNAKSKEKLAQVTVMAGEVKVQAENRLSELKVQIQATIDEINALVAENKQLISEAPKGKEGTSALVAIRNEIAMIETSVTEAGEMFAGGDFLGTYDKVTAARDKALSINAELKEVIAKYKAAVRSR